MVKFLVVLALLVVASVSARTLEPSKVREWNEYKAKHDKSYPSVDEEEKHLQNFLVSKDFVERHNARYDKGEVSFNVTLNKFADMSNDEIRRTYKGFRPTSRRNNTTRSQFKSPPNFKTPAAIDWRAAGVVSPVKDQGGCGGCWAFSTTGAIESLMAIYGLGMVLLSEQQLIDCCSATQGCDGGDMDDAFQYIIDNGGIDSEDSYPYVAETNSCKSSSGTVVSIIESYTDIRENDESDLTEAIAAAGPVSVAIDASKLSFRLYSSGVYDEPDCSSTALDHAVLAVGYNGAATNDYYIVKNSWGTGWGLNGYILMSRNKQNQCGIATMASYPVL